MNSLLHKNILITGASKGIGKATALLFASYKVNIGLIARSEAELLAVQSEIIAKGSNCSIYVGNIGDEAFVNSTVQSFIQAFGSVDIMINNAGFGIFKPAEEITVQDWDDVFATNTKGTFLFCKAVIPIMKENKKGHIINLASDVAKRTFANGSLYCASKYAQDAFSMAIRKELRPHAIKVTVVYSGLVDSYFHAEPEGDTSHKNWLKNEDMANAIVYIASQPKHVVIDELMIHPLEQEY
ncbi:SDR family oxidoreductase [Ferruginibacter lapsinanis]|uniref:SDR family oxidoreductase n=1 Tax=Ferruginibacter lapsinanis TaxID=563172 RepID=UPI001E4E98AE|nr:SDR family oxidoreductase [Ferruginibacter lapsinanis]UEG51263.1 SDR family oxidoreductase [Ferruginibacter lapsinanis]